MSIALLGGNLAQRNHDLGGVDSIGTVSAAHPTSQAEPDVTAGQDTFHLTKLDEPQDAIGTIVHCRGRRTAGPTLMAVVAQLDGLPVQSCVARTRH